jgi:biotin operon repressor
VAIECDRWEWRDLFASEHGPPLPTTRLVLFVISIYMNPSGKNAFLGQALIASRTGLSERAVGKHIALAKEAGWLTIHKRHREGQAWYGLQYAAAIPDTVVIHRKKKPWAKDSQPGRPEPGAGRQAKRPEPGAGRHGERPERNDRRPAQNGTTTSTNRSNDQHHVPTILGLNSGSELRNIAENSDALKNTLPGVEKLRAIRIRKALAANPSATDAQIAAAAKTDIADVERFRGQA